MIEITLTPAEIMFGASAGVMREVANIKNGAKHKYGATDKNDWQMHIEGALAEMALAKHLNIYWSGKGAITLPDVGDQDVRVSASHNNRLILHPDDHDGRRYWLVTGQYGSYRIKGWILGRDGKRDEFWSDPSGSGRPAFFVPQCALTPGVVFNV